VGSHRPSGNFRVILSGGRRRRDVTVTTIADLQYGESDRSWLLAAILAKVGVGRATPLVGQTFSLVEAAKDLVKGRFGNERGAVGGSATA